MPEVSWIIFAAVIVVALFYTFANGINDAANAIATVISTRVLSPVVAIGMAAILNLVGSVVGLEVARTVGKGIISLSPDMGQTALVAVMAGALAGAIWVFLATRYGLPLSVSHSLVAGLLGAGIAIAGVDAIVWSKFIPVLLAVAIAPVLGLLAGAMLRVAMAWIFRSATPSTIQSIFGKLQILSAAFMSFSHGRNDAQNARGIMLLALVLYTGNEIYWDSPPWWVYVVPAVVMGIGTAWGGWRVIKTLGVRITALRPVDGFSAETAGGGVIELASQFGIPVSTTHCITGAIMGTGATRRLSAVRWGVGKTIVAAWILTFPICAISGWLLGHLLNLFL